MMVYGKGGLEYGKVKKQIREYEDGEQLREGKYKKKDGWKIGEGVE